MVSAIDVDILQEYVRSMYQGHSPHLALYETDTGKDTVGHSSEGDLMRSSGIVVYSIYEVIPIQGQVAFAVVVVPLTTHHTCPLPSSVPYE